MNGFKLDTSAIKDTATKMLFEQLMTQSTQKFNEVESAYIAKITALQSQIDALKKTVSEL